MAANTKAPGSGENTLFVKPVISELAPYAYSEITLCVPTTVTGAKVVIAVFMASAGLPSLNTVNVLVTEPQGEPTHRFVTTVAVPGNTGVLANIWSSDPTTTGSQVKLMS